MHDASFPSKTCVTFRPYSAIIGTLLAPATPKLSDNKLRGEGHGIDICLSVPSVPYRSAIVIVYSNEILVTFQPTLTETWQIVYTANVERYPLPSLLLKSNVLLPVAMAESTCNIHMPKNCAL